MQDAAPRLVFRPAREADLPAIVDLLADDFLGQGRGEITGTPAAACYRDAFAAMAAQGSTHLVVATLPDDASTIVGTFQLAIVPGLSYRGASRAMIEGVRIAAPHRRHGLGAELIAEAVRMARDAGARIVQLTTNKARVDAHRFYAKTGFSNSHEGFKLDLG